MPMLDYVVLKIQWTRGESNTNKLYAKQSPTPVGHGPENFISDHDVILYTICQKYQNKSGLKLRHLNPP